MKVLVVGGGTGGHIVPAVTVSKKLTEDGVEVEFWTDRKNYERVVEMTTFWCGDDEQEGGRRGVVDGEDINAELKKSVKNSQYEVENIEVKKVWSGKFHRYNWKWYEYFTNFGITLKDVIWGNIKGICGFIAGTVQSLWRLRKKVERPDVIFLKGGFVGLPVGIVAGWLKIPYIIHESDATLGLANRILAKKARVVATGMEMKGKDGKKSGVEVEMPSGRKGTSGKSGAGKKGARIKKWVCVGIPVAEKFKPVTVAEQRRLKKELGFKAGRTLVMVTGGSQGSVHINDAMAEILPELLEIASVGIVKGENEIDFGENENLQVWEYSSEMEKLLGAADVVVSRAGATTVAELAVLKKAVVLVPFEKLPGGHQVKNAEKLAKEGAVEMVVDAEMVEEPEKLLKAVQELVDDAELRKKMAGKLHELGRTDAVERLVEMIVEVGSE